MGKDLSKGAKKAGVNKKTAKKTVKKPVQKKKGGKSQKGGGQVILTKKEKVKQKPMNPPKKNQKAEEIEDESDDEEQQQQTQKVGKTIVKDKSQQKKKESKSKQSRFQQATNNKNIDNKCVLYIGHLPYGCQEDQLKQYFGQYGTIKAVKLGRSRKTARSKGYGFVQYEVPQVAEIAAKTMNGYMVLGKVLDVHVLTKEQPNPFNFKNGAKQFKFINWSKKFTDEYNSEKDKEQLKKNVNSLLEKEGEKRKLLKELGIDYNFPGFESQVKAVSK